MQWWNKLLDENILLFLTVLIVPVLVIILGWLSIILKQRSSDEFKRTMIEKGMSAEDIERVINTGTHKGSQNQTNCICLKS
jgi:hypothetical protein